MGTTAESSLACVQLSERFAGVRAAVGIQPNYCAQVQDADWDAVCELASHPSVCALGETGLDRYWDHTPFDTQEDYFDRHLRLSQQRDQPFVVHMRDCGEDVLRMLTEARKRGPLRGVMHSFTGDEQLMRECVDLGLHISFAGMVTYKKSHELRAVARCVPDDRLLIETDAPYLSPHPKRGQRPNEPALIEHTATCLAEVRSTTAEKLSLLTFQNAEQLFGAA